MRIVLRRRKTFEAYKLIECGTWNYTIDLNGNGSFTVTELLYGVEGDILTIYEGKNVAFVITGADHKNGVTTLKTASILKLFDMPVKTNHEVDYYNGELGYIKAIADYRIKNNSTGDSFTNIPWINTSIEGNGTNAVPSRLEESGYFNFLEYVKERLEARTISFSYELTNNGVNLHFAEYSDEAYIYDMTTGRYQLISDSSSFNVVSKIIASTKDNTTGTWSEKTYYFFTDGTYSEDKTAGERVDGTVKHINNPKETTIADTFSANEYKSNVSFYSSELPSDFVYGHTVIIKLPDSHILTTVITSVNASSNDSRYNISTGNVIKSRNEFIKKAYSMAVKASADINSLRG